MKGMWWFLVMVILLGIVVLTIIDEVTGIFKLLIQAPLWARLIHRLAYILFGVFLSEAARSSKKGGLR